MPPKVGAKYQVDHKDTTVRVRLTEKEVETLDDICAREHMSRSEVLRKGIELQKWGED